MVIYQIYVYLCENKSLKLGVFIFVAVFAGWSLFLIKRVT